MAFITKRIPAREKDDGTINNAATEDARHQDNKSAQSGKPDQTPLSKIPARPEPNASLITSHFTQPPVPDSIEVDEHGWCTMKDTSQLTPFEKALLQNLDESMRRARAILRIQEQTLAKQREMAEKLGIDLDASDSEDEEKDDDQTDDQSDEDDDKLSRPASSVTAGAATEAEA